jgi:hypothetical protein
MSNHDDVHNRIATEFTTHVVKEVIGVGGGFAQFMVVVETILLAVMMVNVKVFNCSPAASVGLVESAVQRAIVRFTEKMNAGL